jgi:hypothetical protein
MDFKEEIRLALMNTIKPTKLLSRLRRVHRREQGLNLALGLLALCNWIGILFFVGFAIDWYAHLPAFVRIIILVPLLLFPIVKAWLVGWSFFKPWFSSQRAALKVEDHFQDFESLLVSGVQLSASGAVSGTSKALVERTVKQANKLADKVDAEKVVSLNRIGVPGLFGCLLLVSLCAFAAVDFPVFKTAATRLYTPWIEAEYPTRTQIEVEHGERIVKEGEGLRLVANISGEIPDSAEIILRTGKGKPRERKLPITNGVCEYEAQTVFRSFDFRIFAGDARSQWQTVRVISAPRIERAEVSLKFPEYTRRLVETIDALTMTVPEGTAVEWNLTLDRPVSEAEFRPAEGEVVPLQIGADGRSVSMQQIGAQSRAYSFGWVDKEYGFNFSSPRHYLQVAPDRAPSVDFTSPSGNLFATLQRNFDFTFRGRDDHGIGEAAITYRLNKSEEKKVDIPVPDLSDGSEQQVDWNFREALPELAVGDTVSFAIELADRYPGDDGPHRVRSDSRRVQFLSKEDYLAQIEKKKRRLLTQIRIIYREERDVHDQIRNLDPSADVFVQTCQVEAVRQDLMRERLKNIRFQFDALAEDIIANKVADEAESSSLVKLGSELTRIGEEYVGMAASLLRELATVDDTKSKSPAAAIDMVNSSARELGLVVLQLGFAEASDVMARELHSTAQTQAALRLRVIADEDEEKGDLEKVQTRLAKETSRLLAATPSNKESSSVDALIAFNLSRLVNGLVRSGADAKMLETAALISKGEAENATRIQAEVIAALLKAEFRLRLGAEYEALTIARDIFSVLVTGHKNLREESLALTPEDFSKQKLEITDVQSRLQRQVQLLLMPEIPAFRPSLFETIAPTPPPIERMLVTAEKAMVAALTNIKSGDRETASGHQQDAETAFTELAEVTRKRMKAITQEEQMKTSINSFGKQSTQLFMLEERLLVLLEQLEDAADDEVNTAFLTALNQALSKDVEGLGKTIALWSKSQDSMNEEYQPLLGSLNRIADALRAATPLLKDNKPDDAIECQEQALDAIDEAKALIEELSATRSSFAAVLGITENALAPSPLLTEIEDEQFRLTEVTKKAKKEDYLGLVIPQKNLIHAVDAVLTSLDPMAHRIESGTVMVFAKEDMDAAAIGLEEDDIEETIDAQSFVVESLQELRGKIDKVTPEYRYILEVTEFMYGVVPQNAVIRNEMNQWRNQVENAANVEELKKKTEKFGNDLQKLTGEERYVDTASGLVDVISEEASESEIDEALDGLVADIEDMQLLMENLAYLITPPPLGVVVEEPSKEVKMIYAALSVASHHKDLFRNTQIVKPDQMANLAVLQRKLASECKFLLPALSTNSLEPGEQQIDIEPGLDSDVEETEIISIQPHPNIKSAHRHLIEAVAKLESGDRDAAIISQKKADDALRYFILEYTLKYVAVPPPAPPADPAPSDDALPDDSELQLFLPGSLTGKRPKGGRVEWEVLGRRDRAALNENFARELPLEYRAILKDYYEQLTE